MAKKMTAAQIKKQQDKLIEQIYCENCSGMQINIMNIPKLFAMAGKMIDQGASKDAIVAAMWGFCAS